MRCHTPDLTITQLVKPSGEEQTIYTSQTETLEANCPPVTWTECVDTSNKIPSSIVTSDNVGAYLVSTIEFYGSDIHESRE